MVISTDFSKSGLLKQKLGSEIEEVNAIIINFRFDNYPKG